MSNIKPSDELEEAMQAALESVESKEPGTDEPDIEVVSDDPEAAATPSPAPAAEASAEPQAAANPAAELKDQLLRLAADFENFRKRARREQEELHRYGAESLVRDILGVVDNFERALAHTTDDSPIVEGIRMVHKQMLDVLASHGVKGFDSVDQTFDPELHEAMSQTPSDKPAGSTVAELEHGYMLHDRLLRPAKVVVASAPQEPTNADEG